MHQIFAVIAVIVAATPAFADDLPNPNLTPGAVNPDITQANIHSTICVAGYTMSIRSPANYDNAIKRKMIDQYGYKDKKMADYELDHLVPVDIGGSQTDPRNPFTVLRQCCVRA
jgi:hypothetical protein